MLAPPPVLTWLCITLQQSPRHRLRVLPLLSRTPMGSNRSSEPEAFNETNGSSSPFVYPRPQEHIHPNPYTFPSDPPGPHSDPSPSHCHPIVRLRCVWRVGYGMRRVGMTNAHRSGLEAQIDPSPPPTSWAKEIF
jgi:hypothetical protein